MECLLVLRLLPGWSDARRLLNERRNRCSGGNKRLNGQRTGMTEDERAMRELVASWMTATAPGDANAVLNLKTRAS
jgi:hypothetical protein